MRQKETIITGLDIGSSKVTAVAALSGAVGEVRVARYASVPSKGVSRGVFGNLNDAVEAVSKALAKLREGFGRRPENIFVNISGVGIRAERSVGMAPLAFRGREVTNLDIQKSIDAAGTVTLPMDREIIHRIVRRFSVDQENFIGNPLGLHAAKLTCEIYLVSAPANQIHDIQKCVNDAGYEIKEAVFTGMADGHSILDPREKEEGVALLDVGHAMTEVCVFSDGVLAGLGVTPFGAKDVKNDFRDNAAVGEAMADIASHIKRSADASSGIKSVIVTGGAVFIDGFIEFIEERLSYPAKMGVVKDVVGNISGIDRMRATTAIGLAKYGAERMSKAKGEFRTPFHLVSSKVTDLLNNYF